MNTLDIISILAIIAAPVVAVIIGQKLQNRAKKRQDKMEIFKTLMTSRIHGWTPESVFALNVIDIVFADDKNVRNQWKTYHDKLCVSDPTQEDLKKIQTEQYKLLETIAVSLGYKDKITWETIQNPYIPDGMVAAKKQQEQMVTAQIKLLNLITPQKTENPQ